MRRRPLRAVAAGAVGLLVASVLAACVPGTGPIDPSVPTGERVSAALEPYYHQELQWEWCGRQQCATAIAPLDWSAPGEGDDVELALVRQPATGGDRLGSLLVNPGGPGASGVDFVSGSVDFAVGDALQQRYDIVGFDPRGVGGSTAVDCGGPEVLDEFLYGIPDAPLGSDEWIAEVREASAVFGAACAEHSDELLRFVDTASAARDLDLLRAILGDERLAYLGYSYGTLLGAVYAELFPDRTGRLVLDGAIDPAATDVDMSLAQAVGFEGAFDAYLRWCLGGSGCPFEGGVDDARERTGELIASLTASPLSSRDGREVGSAVMFIAIVTPLYSESTWPRLSELFAATLRGDPTVALGLADSYNQRRSDGTYRGNVTESFTAIFCLDERSSPDLAQIRADEARIVEAAPLFGPLMAYGATSCADWPVPAVRDRVPITAPGSSDILVIGTTNDPATPYEWAVTLAGTLDRGHLVTFDGEGHTAYNKGSECIDQVVEAFLVDGVVPASDPRC